MTDGQEMQVHLKMIILNIIVKYHMKETPTPAADPDYVEKYLICQKWDIQNWSVNADGTIDVDGDVNLYKKELTKLPDLSIYTNLKKLNCSFNNNIIGNMLYNSFSGEFYHNFTDMSSIFRNNSVKCEVSNLNLIVSGGYPTHIYNGYNCDVILTSGFDVKLSYYNGSNALTVVDIGA